MELGRDFRELLDLLNRHRVRYLVAGGYATSIYAEPRYTKDLDLWVERDPLNAERILAALQEFGFASVGLSEEDFLRDDHVIQLGYPPNRIDLLTRLAGVTFSECYPRRELVMLAGLEVPFIAAPDLVVNKRTVGRLRDLADVEDILRYQDL